MNSNNRILNVKYCFPSNTLVLRWSWHMMDKKNQPSHTILRRTVDLWRRGKRCDSFHIPVKLVLCTWDPVTFLGDEKCPYPLQEHVPRQAQEKKGESHPALLWAAFFCFSIHIFPGPSQGLRCIASQPRVRRRIRWYQRQKRQGCQFGQFLEATAVTMFSYVSFHLLVVSPWSIQF